jgi:tetratricopeptide (TPR) repeat protein
VSAFEIFSCESKSDEQKGKALADLLVDDLHEILAKAKDFTGNAYSSKDMYPPLPERSLPQIPVDTTYGIEIKGISLDHMLATWKHLRYREFHVSGDVIKIADGQLVLKVRYETEGRANSFAVPSSPAMLEDNLKILALNLIADISPETAQRYLFQAVNCPQCGVNWIKAQNFCFDWLKRAPHNPGASYCLGYVLAWNGPPQDSLPYLEQSIALYKKKHHFWEEDNSYAPLDAEGIALIRAGSYGDALKAFKASLKARKTATAMMNLGVVAELQGNYKEAQKSYLKASKMEDGYVCFDEFGTFISDGQFVRSRS